MEAVGFAASLLTLLSTLIEVSTVIRELKRNFGECPPALANLASAVTELERLITFVKSLDETRLKDHGDLDRRLFQDCKALVEKCTQDLSEIQQKLEQLRRPPEKGFRSRLVKAVKRLNHDRDIDVWWNQVLHYNQHFSALLTRIGMNENRLNSNGRIGSLEDAAMLATLHDVQSSTALLPSMHMDIRFQKTTADRMVASQQEDGRNIRDIQQVLSQHVLDAGQYRQTARSTFSGIHSKLDGLQADIAQTSRMSQLEQNILIDLCAGMKELQPNVDALNRKVSRSENTELDTTTQQATSSLLRMNDLFGASFLRLLQLSEQSMTQVSSTLLKSTIKDLVRILDHMKTLIGTTVSSQSDRWVCDQDDFEYVRSVFQLTQRLELANPDGPNGNFQTSLEDNLVRPLGFTALPMPTVPPKGSLVRAKFASVDTSMGRLNLLVKMSECYPVDDSFGDASESQFLAKVSLLPRANLEQQTLITFQCEQLRCLGGTLLKPTCLSFKAIRKSDCEVFRIAEFGSANTMAMLFANGEASITDHDEYGRSLLGRASCCQNLEMVKCLIAAGADIDAFEPIWEWDSPPFATVATNAFSVASCTTSRWNHRSSEVVKVMVQAGAEIDSPIEYIRYVFFITCSLQYFRVILDHAEPSMTSNSVMNFSLTTLVILIVCHNNQDAFEIPSKIALLISRGADLSFRHEHSETYLHVVLKWARRDCHWALYENLVTRRHHGELKDILMLFVSAGADVYAVNDFGESVSDVALEFGFRLEWEETLEECGYNVLDVLNHGYEKDDTPCQEGRRPLLTFVEYLEMRKSRLLNLEIGGNETPETVYKRYYAAAVPADLRIHEISNSDSGDSEMEDDEDDFDDEIGSTSDAESFDTATEMVIEET